MNARRDREDAPDRGYSYDESEEQELRRIRDREDRNERTGALDKPYKSC